MMGLAHPGALEFFIENLNMAIWAVVGGVLGWLASTLYKPETYLVFLENMAVAVFGAFLGGEFVATQFRTGPKSTDFSIASLGFSVACAIGMLLLLRLMRRAVGPLKPGKAKPRR